jgi:hypothetical protein
MELLLGHQGLKGSFYIYLVELYSIQDDASTHPAGCGMIGVMETQ